MTTNTIRLFQPGHDPKYLIFAEGKFGRTTSKTANVVLRYQSDRVCAIVDSRYAGKTAGQVNSSLEAETPIIGSVSEGLEHNPTHLIIGIAPAGGQLPAAWVDPIKEAITGGLHIISGLHAYLTEHEELATLAQEHGVELIDLRKPPELTEISQGLWRERDVPVVQTIAPDCAMGKFTASWEFKKQLENRGYNVGLVATGQTGILLYGEGIVVDAVKGDFMSCAIEILIQREIEKGADVVLVEGQGAIYHEGFSAVTLGILHGAMPDAFLFVHQPSSRANDYGYQFPPYRQMINDYEHLIEWFKPAHTIGVQLNTSNYEPDTARALCDDVAHHTGLPTTDFVRFPGDPAIDTMIQKLNL